MIRLSKRPPMIILFLFTACISGCVTTGTTDGGKSVKRVVSEIKQAFEGTFIVDPAMETDKPRTIAVLPFVDVSKSQKGTEIVRRGFYNHFSSLPYKDMELFQVDQLLKKAGLYDPESLSTIAPEKLKDILNVDAVVMGTISNFDKLFAGIYSQVSVGAEIKIIDTTGQFLWSGEHVVRIRQGSLPTSPIGIIAAIISASMNIRDVQLLRACDDLFRDMVKTIPAIKPAKAHIPPTISLLAQDAKGRPRKAGDEIRVLLRGTPGMSSWFDIGDFRRGIDMKEIEPGGYVGTYRVVPGDNTEGAIVIGYLDDGIGKPARWVDALGTLILDTIPPETPTNGTAIGRDHSISLAWDENKERDLAGYILYRSETPLSGFEKIEQTEFTHFEDGEAPNLKTYYYRISAVDRAGNESIETQAVSGTAIPPGPTPVAGVVERDTTWYAGASPYILDETVEVSENATLTIEPGTRIEATGGALVIKGKLVASGGNTQLITFESPDGQGWGGIAFHRVKGDDSIIEYARIADAVIGVDCRTSSPVIRQNEFVRNQIGIRVSGGYAKPTIESNIIRKSTSTGIVVREGAAPTLTDNQIQHNDREGLLIENAGTVLLKHNRITNNMGTGIVVRNSETTISENNIYDNHPYDIEGDFQGKAIDADSNWWGDGDWKGLLERISGRVSIGKILDKAFPEGQAVPIPILDRVLGGTITEDAILILSNSPYRVATDLTVDSGAALNIQAGVTILYDKQTSIVLKDGGIIAKGTKDHPITFTASGSSPSPGDYMNAVRFSEMTGVSSFFRYGIFKYATVALDVRYGMPEITYSTITDSSQSAIRSGNDSAPRILYNTIAKNLGSGGIECVGLAKPKINHNNFEGNTVAIQAFSTIFIDARNNFWGKSPPDKSLIFGDNINIEPWLEMPEEDAFCASCDP